MNKKRITTIITVTVIAGFLALVVILVATFFVMVFDTLRPEKKSAINLKFDSTVQMANHCMSNGQNINAPIEGRIICKGFDGVWPDLGSNNAWGELIDGDTHDGSFEYKAYLSHGKIEVDCNESGCTFANTYPTILLPNKYRNNKQQNNWNNK